MTNSASSKDNVDEAEADAVGLIPVGVGNKPLPSILITTKSEISAIQNDWFKIHQSPRSILITLKIIELNLVAGMLRKRLPREDVGGPVGTYIASRWEADIRTDYFLTPQESVAILKKISTLEIPEDTRTILEQAIHRPGLPH